jgi:chorismate synthase
MSGLHYRTAGESHGPALVALVEGLPRGLNVDEDWINGELRRRQGGYGRGARQRIETDSVQILAGVRRGCTTGGPVVLQIINRDSRLDEAPAVHRPRPGHADLAGSIKWLTKDCRETLERASARETAARTAAGALAGCLLREFGIQSCALVMSIGSAEAQVNWSLPIEELKRLRDASDVYCPDTSASDAMRALIRQAKIDGDTLGGLIETRVFGCPPGLGSCVQWTQKLDGRIARAVMSVQAIKSVEIGLGKDVAFHPGSRVHDPIEFDRSQLPSPNLGFVRPTNNAGGLEGGMTNGAPLVVRAAMKPIATLLKPLPSVDLQTHQPEPAVYERSDVCAVPAASVILEHVVAFEVASAMVEKFAGDSFMEMRANYDEFLRAARALATRPGA